MKKSIFFSFFLFLFIVPISSQNSTSRVIYHAKHLLPVKDLKGKNTLHFNKTQCLYIHNNFPLKTTTQENQNFLHVSTGDDEQFPVFISLEDSLMYSKVAGPNGIYSMNILKEKLEPIEWEIKQEQKKIKQYNCIKAIATYEGRKYTAWFTPDIPVPYGPYKLGGLPGLILEAESDDKKVLWKFVGYEIATRDSVQLRPPTQGKVFTWEEYVEAKLNYKIRKESLSDDEGTIIITDRNPSLFIEKGKFSIYKRYLNKEKKK